MFVNENSVQSENITALCFSCRFSRICVAFLWSCIAFYGFYYGLTWPYMVLYGRSMVLYAFYGLLWSFVAFMAFYGFLWPFMAMYGLLWLFMAFLWPFMAFLWQNIIFSHGHRSKFI